jgi:hypothetical protein
MADIDVVPKRKTSAWVWLLLALAIIAVLWFVMGRTPAAERVGRSGTEVPARVLDASPSIVAAAPPRA